MMLLHAMAKQFYVDSSIEPYSIILWIVGGLISGFIASQIVNSRGDGIIRDIVMGIVGAFIGSWVLNYFGWGAITGLNLFSLFITVVGSGIFLAVYHTISHRYTYR